MFRIDYNKKFKSSYKKLIRSGNFDYEEYTKIISYFVKNILLPTKYHDHTLKGNLSGLRECHIRGDILLIYEIDLENKKVLLHNIGNHAQLFE